MTTPGETATPRPTFDPCALTTWALSSLADCASPDRPDRYGWGHDVTGETFDPSPGAELLRRVAYGVAEAIEYAGDDFDPERPDDVNDDGTIDQIADGAPSIYTAARWAEFVDLGAYNEDGADLGGFPDDLTDAAGVALYMIAERLAWALLRDYAETLVEWTAENDDAETVTA